MLITKKTKNKIFFIVAIRLQVIRDMMSAELHPF